MENNNELLDTIMRFVDNFFKDGDIVCSEEKKAFAKTLTELLSLKQYKRQDVVEKETAKTIYGNLYKTALLCKNNELVIGADNIKEMAKDVYDIDIVVYPYKKRVTESYGNYWAVYYFHNNEECNCLFSNEYMADAFIKKLKETEGGQGNRDL